ncbi:endolysin [Bacillus phage Slash]|uniref:Secreted N-acetylmuramyl-L-alanine amidase n=2 Tax=Slashvirus TaxID=1921709 RepID=U5PWL4_9CAUD|nr:endolysin [Bacillus phage Staley]YP_008771932.1 endolysin [Bacillus phage Slash]AGY48319.1 secreted N-acetylmuramyl-L-alanine amidase [Bacillus phage Slash]AGY48714.1 N-acetylmuramyl-L-alanine amidase [Bacillus phage Staley]
MKKLTQVGIISSVLLSFGFAANAEASETHTVRSGDTMNKIAAANGMGLDQLVAKNPQIPNPNMIYVGQAVNVGEQTSVPAATTTTTSSGGISSSEKDLMARLVRAEAQGEPYAGKVAVATVILNRVSNADFPNTISGVINQPGQFSPVSNGQINKAADNDSVRAVNEAIANRGQGAGSLFFYNPKTSTNTWITHRPVTVVIANHTFAK